MNIVTRRVLNCSYEHAKPLMLRLCKKSYCTLYIDSTSKRKALISFQRFPERSTYSLQHRKCTNLAAKTDDQESFPKTKFLREHELMHSLLQSSVHYANSIMPPIKTTANVTEEEIGMLRNVNWSSESPMSILKAFKKLTYCHLNGVQFENEIFENILKACNVKLPEFDDKQIQKLMQCLIVLQKLLKESNVNLRFQKSLDKECLKRFYSSDFTELLLMVDAFYQLKAWDSNYAWRALRKMGTKSNKLSPKQLVQFLFFKSLYKVPDLNMFEIQYRLEECLPDLTANEVGVVARGFFLTESKIYNKSLMTKIIIKIKNNASNMQDVTFAATMKLIRYSNCSHCKNELTDLLEALRAEVPHRQLMALTHIAHLAGGQRVYDKPLLDGIFARIDHEIHSARIKDIERFIYAVCTVTSCTEYQDECNKLVNELVCNYKTNRAEEMNFFLKPLPRIIVFLTYKNIYPRELIEYIMDPEYVTKTYKYNLKLLTNEFLIINCSLKIELPDYTGPFLDDKIYTYLVKKYCQSPRKSNIYERLSFVKLQSEIKYICKEQLGLHLYIDTISPHFITEDTILGLNECNNPISVEPILSAMPFGSIKRVDTDDLRNIQWKVLLILTSAQKVIGHKSYISGVYKKFRQLKAIGYTPIPICEDTWNSFSTDYEKCDYLRRQIFQESPLTVL